jgi:hypothetical protein
VRLCALVVMSCAGASEQRIVFLKAGPTMDNPAKRDPFAPPGVAGNRTYGSNGPIPPEYRWLVELAVPIVYGLNNKSGFNTTFIDTVSKLSIRPIQRSSTLFIDSCNRAILNLADNTTDIKVIKNMRDVPDVVGFSFPLGENIWLKRSLFESKNIKDLAATILHEVCHIAGARGDMLAEVALNIIHNAAGLPRVK